MISISQKKTANGLPLVFVKNPKLNGVVATLFINSGSAHEPKKYHGISHLVEHLIFSKNKTSKKHYPFNLELEAITRKDFTYFEISHHESYLKKMIRVLLSAVSSGDFSKKDLQIQKSVIFQEMSERDEDPFAVLENAMDANNYLGSSWTRDVLGNKKTLKSIDLGKISAWHSTGYSPENMLLAISGNFDEKEIFTFINKEVLKFFPRKKQKTAQTLPSARYKKPPTLQITRIGFEQAYLGLSFPANEKVGGGNYFEYLLLADIFSRKLQLALKKIPDFYDVDFYYHHYLNNGEFRAITSVQKSAKEKATENLLSKIEKLDATRSFFEKIRDFSAKQFLLREDNVDDLASLPLYKLAGAKKILTPREEAERIMKVDYKKFLKSKESILKKDNCHVAILI